LAQKTVSGVGQREAHIEQAGKAHRFFQAVKAHATGAQVDALHRHLLSLLIFQCDRQLDAGTKEFLLLEADESQGVRALSGRDVNVVFPSTCG